MTKSVKSKNFLECNSVFHCPSLHSTEHSAAASESNSEMFSPCLCVGVCCFLSTHYYDCSGTMTWSEVMLIASDQDNTVAYGRTNTMRGHFYPNKALPSPPPGLYTVLWTTEQGQYWHRKPEELNQNKNNHTTVFCPLFTDLLVSYSSQIQK